MNNRACSLLELRSVDEEMRFIEGIATTPETDRMNDIVETAGITFKLPIPLLYQHNSKQPIGKVLAATVSKSGIQIKAQMAKAGVAPWIDEAWALVKAGLTPGLSIGFKTIEEVFNEKTGGFRILKSEWLELSVVTLPANASATITSVKSADAALLAVPGNRSNVPVRLDTTTTFPGVTGRQLGTKMTTQEQITQFENKRAASSARMDSIMTKAGETGSVLDPTEQQEYDTLENEVKEVDAHLVRLRAHQDRMTKTAAPIVPRTPDARTPETTVVAPLVPSGRISVKSNLPKGTIFSRWVMAQVEAKNDKYRAVEVAKQLYPETPEVELILRAQVAAGTTTGTTWAAPLVAAAQNMLSEFLDLLRPATIIGRIPGITRVPVNIVVPMQTGGGTGYWVGEAQPKPVSALAFSAATLRWAKAIVMTVISEELIRFSSPSAEAIVRNSLVKDLRKFLDEQFVSTNAEVTNVSPAGILNGATTAAAGGTTPAFFLSDVRTALATFIAAGYDLSQLVMLTSSTVGMNLGLLRDTQGNTIYPNVGPMGGTILGNGPNVGITVVVSEAVGNKIIFMVADEILLADDGGIFIDSSNQASILMDDNPGASPATTALVSLYQRNLVAIKTEQFITWKKARATSVYYISNAAYTG